MKQLFIVLILVCAHGAHAAHFSGKSVVQEQLVADSKHQAGSYTWLSKENKSSGIIGGVILGCLLWCLVPIAIFNTERISAKQAKMRFKAQRYAVHLDDPDLNPLEELNGRIVYVKGQTECTEELKDDKFAKVKSEGKIKLRRVVEMYQNVEHEKEEGDGDNKKIVYYYTQEWCDYESSCPHDQAMKNPRFPFPSTKRQDAYQAWAAALAGNGEKCAEAQHKNVHMGKYYLDDYVIREMRNWKDKEDVTEDMLAINDKGTPKKSGNYWYFEGAESSEKIGSLRVRFEELCTGPITICGVLAKNETGWSFMPIVKKDAQGSCDSLVAECGTSCCFSVEELHYDDEDADAIKELEEKLHDRQKEFTTSTLKGLKKSGTMKEQAEDDMDDLCCTGVFGTVVKSLLNHLGLEDEFLAVTEDDPQPSLNGLIKSEAAAMDSKVNVARLSSFCCLIFATLLIISPIMKLLNYNWLVTMLGGGLLSCLICSCAMLFTCSAYACLVSTAWVWYRPFLSVVALAVAIVSMVGVGYICLYVYEEIKAHQGQSASSSFLAMRDTWGALSHHM